MPTEWIAVSGHEIPPVHSVQAAGMKQPSWPPQPLRREECQGNGVIRQCSPAFPQQVSMRSICILHAICKSATMGMVKGPIDVGADSPQLLDGAALQRWFAERGAPLVERGLLTRAVRRP
jgi:hypothetical protein